MKLKLSDTLSLPIDAVTQRFAFLGRIGSGKSYGAQKLAELMDDVHGQFIVLDPVGNWFNLRIAGKGKPIEIPVFGGLHGDAALTPTSGAMFADLVVDRGLSAVLDVSQFESDKDKARFAQGFADRFFFRKKASPSAVHLFIEEAQEFIPQHPQHGEELMLHAFTRMAKLGRNFGIGLSIISQRPQEINKKVLNLTECLLAFQMTGVHERKSVQEWAVARGAEDEPEKLRDLLPFIKEGEPHIWSPVWLNVAKTFRIAEKRTADGSQTPKVGAKRVVRELTPVDIEALRDAIAATIEKAKSEDPTELRKKIAGLEKELRTKPVKVPSEPKIVEVEVRVPVLQPEVAETLRAVAKEVGDVAAALRATADDVLASLKCMDDTRIERSVQRAQPVRVEKAKIVEAPKKTNGAAHPANVDEIKLGRCAREILRVLVQRGRSSNAQLAVLSGYSIKSSSFSNAKSELRTHMLADGVGDEMVATEVGRAFLGPVDPLPTGQALIEQWKAAIDACPRKMLHALCGAYPRELTKEELSELTGYSISSSSFSNGLSSLRSLELMEGRGNAGFKASHIFFQGDA